MKMVYLWYTGLLGSFHASIRDVANTFRAERCNRAFFIPSFPVFFVREYADCLRALF